MQSKKLFGRAGLCLALVACASVAPAVEPTPFRIHVKPGDSLAAVRDVVRRQAPVSCGVEVILAPGRYSVGEGLSLDAGDSGRSGAPVVWRSAPGGRAVLCDGQMIPVSAFAPASNDRIDAAVRGKVLAADLSSCDVVYWNPSAREFRQPMPIPELFVDGVRMTPAQWPNDGGWATIEKILDKGPQDNDGSVTQGLGVKRERKPEPLQGGVFRYAGDRPSRWTKAPEVWLHGFWCFDWYDTVIPVASINTVSNTIAFAAKHTYGVRQGNPSPRRWKAVHLLEELDAPGEYFVDREAKRLYFLPPKSFGPASRVVLTGRWRTLAKLKDAHDLVFQDLDFEECQGDAVSMSGCARVAFRGCTFRNIRGKAIVGNGVTDCRVVSSDIFNTGTGAISLYGGDRRTLTPGGNLIEDTLIRDFSEHCLTYASAIHLGGVGNVARHNEISGAPHMAVGVSGNDQVFEYNIVSNVCMCSDDAAAFYKGRNPSCRGNVLRYNFWSEIGSPRGHGNAAIYFDDGDCGDLVYGNVFYRCGEPGFGGFGTVFCHGGHSNIVQNSIFIECKRPLGSSPWNQQRWADFLKSPLEQTRLLKEVNATSAVWVARYPAIRTLFAPEKDEARWNAAYDNAFIDCPLSLPGRKPGEAKPGICCGRWYTNTTDVVMSGDPGFVNAAAKDFSLRPDAALFRKLPGFKPIPFSKIGLIRKR